MAEPRKPPRRPEGRREITRIRYRRFANATTIHLQSFPPAEVNRQASIVEQALDAKKVDWQKIAPSIEYLQRARDDITYANNELAKFLRSLTREGTQLPPKDERRLRRIKDQMDRANDFLERVEARRNRDQGRKTT